LPSVKLWAASPSSSPRWLSTSPRSPQSSPQSSSASAHSLGRSPPSSFLKRPAKRFHRLWSEFFLCCFSLASIHYFFQGRSRVWIRSDLVGPQLDPEGCWQWVSESWWEDGRRSYGETDASSSHLSCFNAVAIHRLEICQSYTQWSKEPGRVRCFPSLFCAPHVIIHT